MSQPVTRNLAVLMTDIKGFTDKTSRRTRSEIQEMLEEHKRLVLPVLEKHGGRLIKTIGDAFLMVYESPTDAVLAGVETQEILAKHNEGLGEDDRLEIRIAINSGEVNLADDDVFGEPVNITARIQGVSLPGEVFFTEAVYLTMNKSEVPSAEVGLLQLKGIHEKVRVYKVRRESPASGAVSPGPLARRHLWDLLRGRMRPAGAAGEEAKAAPALPGSAPSLFRRWAALCIDGIVCFILVGMVVPADKFTDEYDTYHIGYDRGAPLSPGKVRRDKVEVRLGGAEVSREKLLENGPWQVSKVRKKRSIAFPVFWVAFSTLFLALWGATPGAHVMKLLVVQTSGLPIEWKHALTRSIISLISGYGIGLGYLWAIWEKDRRGWHDLMSGTVVVRRGA